MKPIQVGLLGLGTVGGATLTVLRRNKEEIARGAGREIRVVQAAVRDLEKAKAFAGEGLDLTTDPMAVIDNPEIDIVAELIGGIEPARTLVLKAIQNGKHVVTANKALIAKHGNEIFAAAQEKGVMVAFEAAVAGGIPIIKAIREGLTANRIQWLAGIINVKRHAERRYSGPTKKALPRHARAALGSLPAASEPFGFTVSSPRLLYTWLSHASRHHSHTLPARSRCSNGPRPAGRLCPPVALQRSTSSFHSVLVSRLAPPLPRGISSLPLHSLRTPTALLSAAPSSAATPRSTTSKTLSPPPNSLPLLAALAGCFSLPSKSAVRQSLDGVPGIARIADSSPAFPPASSQIPPLGALAFRSRGHPHHRLCCPFDVLPLLVATDGAVAAFGRDVRRLRPNVLIGNVPGLSEGQWPGAVLEIVSLVVRLDSLRGRCPMTTVDPDTLDRDPEVLRDIGRRFGGRLALNADVVQPGSVAVGDAVRLVHVRARTTSEIA